MNANALSGKEASETIDEQRAEWEGANFAMTVLSGAGGGYVNVKNDNYGDDAGAHIYSVRVEAGHAVGCSCPHATHHGTHCKHQVAVEHRPLVVSSATAAASTRRVATDGGRVEDTRCDECGHTFDRDEDGPDCPECGGQHTDSCGPVERDEIEVIGPMVRMCCHGVNPRRRHSACV